MKVKYLRTRIDEISRILKDEDPERSPSVLAISQITGLTGIFSTEAQIRLERPEPLTVDDEWLLDALRHTHLHPEFEDAFRRICEADHDDVPRLYARANLWFYRRLDPGQDIDGLVARFRRVMGGIVSAETCEAILTRLRAVRVIADETEPEDART